MTCAQGLLRLLWGGGGAEVGVLRDWMAPYLFSINFVAIPKTHHKLLHKTLPALHIRFKVSPTSYLLFNAYG